ncbi:MAG: Com family DNA-binding transcriptional regulator [Nitrospirota bacterium]
MPSRSQIAREAKRGGAPALAFQEVRCQRCSRLLLRWDRSGPSQVEVKCPRCQEMNLFTLLGPTSC